MSATPPSLPQHGPAQPPAPPPKDAARSVDSHISYVVTVAATLGVSSWNTFMHLQDNQQRIIFFIASAAVLAIILFLTAKHGHWVRFAFGLLSLSAYFYLFLGVITRLPDLRIASYRAPEASHAGVAVGCLLEGKQEARWIIQNQGRSPSGAFAVAILDSQGVLTRYRVDSLGAGMTTTLTLDLTKVAERGPVHLTAVVDADKQVSEWDELGAQREYSAEVNIRPYCANAFKTTVITALRGTAVLPDQEGVWRVQPGMTYMIEVAWRESSSICQTCAVGVDETGGATLLDEGDFAAHKRPAQIRYTVPEDEDWAGEALWLYVTQGSGVRTSLPLRFAPAGRAAVVPG